MEKGRSPVSITQELSLADTSDSVRLRRPSRDSVVSFTLEKDNGAQPPSTTVTDPAAVAHQAEHSSCFVRSGRSVPGNPFTDRGHHGERPHQRTSDASSSRRPSLERQMHENRIQRERRTARRPVFVFGDADYPPHGASTCDCSCDCDSSEATSVESTVTLDDDDPHMPPSPTLRQRNACSKRNQMREPLVRVGSTSEASDEDWDVLARLEIAETGPTATLTPPHPCPLPGASFGASVPKPSTSSHDLP